MDLAKAELGAANGWDSSSFQSSSYNSAISSSIWAKLISLSSFPWTTGFTSSGTTILKEVTIYQGLIFLIKKIVNFYYGSNTCPCSARSVRKSRTVITSWPNPGFSLLAAKSAGPPWNRVSDWVHLIPEWKKIPKASPIPWCGPRFCWWRRWGHRTRGVDPSVFLFCWWARSRAWQSCSTALRGLWGKQSRGGGFVGVWSSW